jgi:hypothetical protein
VNGLGGRIRAGGWAWDGSHGDGRGELGKATTARHSPRGVTHQVDRGGNVGYAGNTGRPFPARIMEISKLHTGGSLFEVCQHHGVCNYQ